MQQPDAVFIEPKQQHKTSVIWLHGLGADGHDFKPVVPQLGLDDELGIRFIFPHAPVRPITINGGMSMRAWYDVKAIDLTRQEDAESIKESANLMEGLIQEERDKNIPTNKIILAGFSQGGAMALYTGLRYSSSLAGILALSTYMPLLENLAGEIHKANKATSILQMHGTFDPVIPVFTAKDTFQKLEELDCQIEWQEYPMLHAVCPQQLSDIGEWIGKRLGS